jgi:putative tryptophan/tyrosine transport system substrate-binding protein
MQFDQLKRRNFIALLGGAAAAWPLSARAQQVPRPVIGYLGLTTPNGEAEMISSFGKGLKESGFEEGRNVSIEFRFAEGDVGRLPALAAELLSDRVAVIVAGTTAAALAAKAATSTVPILFGIGADPIKSGLVERLNRPGANVTGISFFTNQMESKRLGLLHEFAPKAGLIAVLLNPRNPFFDNQVQDVTEASRSLGLKIHLERASDETEITRAFSAFTRLNAGALLVGADLYFTSRRALVIDPAIQLRLPAIYEWRQFAESGGLASYGTVLAEAFRQAGEYAGRMLRGENPAELPVMQATKFEFIINLKTARQIGIEVPPGLSARADEIIE